MKCEDCKGEYPDEKMPWGLCDDCWDKFEKQTLEDQLKKCWKVFEAKDNAINTPKNPYNDKEPKK